MGIFGTFCLGQSDEQTKKMDKATNRQTESNKTMHSRNGQTEINKAMLSRNGDTERLRLRQRDAGNMILKGKKRGGSLVNLPVLSAIPSPPAAAPPVSSSPPRPAWPR